MSSPLPHTRLSDIVRLVVAPGREDEMGYEGGLPRPRRVAISLQARGVEVLPQVARLHT